MLGLNCSLEALATSATVFSDIYCPKAAVVCGMNISWVLANATTQDVDEICLTEEQYLAKHLGPLRSPVFLSICLTYLIIFVVGVLGNSLTCAVILCYKVMQTPTNYYLLSLAVSDLLLLVLSMPLELYEMWQNYPFLLGEGGCYFKTFLFETVCFASILNVTALSIERYIAVVHPLKVKHMTTHAHVRRVIFMLWVMSMVCAVPNTILHGVVVLPPKFGRHFPQSAICYVVKPRWIYNLVILLSTLAFFFLPMLIISILYILIGLHLHGETSMTTVDTRYSFGAESLSWAHKQKLNKSNKQVTKMLCVLVIMFGLCWAPFHVDRLTWSYIDISSEQHIKIFEQVHIISGVCFYLNSAINPILYNLMSTRFREMFSHIACHANTWPSHSSIEMTQHSTLSKQYPTIQNRHKAFNESSP
ncbi:neuromedin-U receptor 1-like [Aulostomus maculatus]